MRESILDSHQRRSKELADLWLAGGRERKRKSVSEIVKRKNDNNKK